MLSNIVKFNFELFSMNCTNTDNEKSLNAQVMCVHEEMKTNNVNKSSNSNGSTSNLRRAIPRSESNFSMSAHSNAPVYQVYCNLCFNRMELFWLIFQQRTKSKPVSIVLGKFHNHSWSSDEADVQLEACGCRRIGSLHL